MPRFMCSHTLPAGTLSADQLRGFSKAAQEDPVVKGHCGFANLAEGKVVCVMDGPDKAAVEAWFKKMGMPFDSITKVELEVEAGTVRPA